MKHRESTVAIINGNMISAGPGAHPPSEYGSPTRQIMKKYEHEHDMELCTLDSERRNGSKGMMEMVGSVGGYNIVTPEKMQTETQAMNEDEIGSLDLDALPFPVSMDMAMPELMTCSMTIDNKPYNNSYPVEQQLSFDTMIADNIDSIFK